MSVSRIFDASEIDLFINECIKDLGFKFMWDNASIACYYRIKTFYNRIEKWGA